MADLSAFPIAKKWPAKNANILQLYSFPTPNGVKASIALEEMADLVHMTVPSFCRYFKKVTNKTFVQFVNEYRLVHASNLLSENKLSITEICFESGFNNFSHFNRLFKEFTGKSASKYRSEMKRMIQ